MKWNNLTISYYVKTGEAAKAAAPKLKRPARILGGLAAIAVPETLYQQYSFGYCSQACMEAWWTERNTPDTPEAHRPTFAEYGEDAPTPTTRPAKPKQKLGKGGRIIEDGPIDILSSTHETITASRQIIEWSELTTIENPEIVDCDHCKGQYLR